MRISKIISMILVIAILTTSLLNINSFGLDAKTSDSGFAKLEKLTKEEIVKLVTDVAVNKHENFYLTPPSVTAPYSLGEVRTDIQQNALDRLNAYRRLAGLDAVSFNNEYTKYAQAAAVVNAANDVLSHAPSCPENMSKDLFDDAEYGASHCNIACYMGYNPINGPLSLSVDMWMEDSDEFNIKALGHRRWMLNPAMKETGFGCATSENGQVYSAVYAFDEAAKSSDYDFISWPPSGYMAGDTSFFTTDHAWSISLNPKKYNVADLSQVTVVLKNDEGKTWNFNNVSNKDAGFFSVDTTIYGINNAIIFRPNDVSEFDGKYTVTVNGIKSDTADATSLSYEVEFFSAENFKNPVSPSTTETESTKPTPTKPTTTTVPSTEKPTPATTTAKPTTTTAAPEAQIMIGDVNDDGAIRSSDARLALRISARLHTPTEKELNAAEVTGDNKITASDARKILRVAARLEEFDIVTTTKPSTTAPTTTKPSTTAPTTTKPTTTAPTTTKPTTTAPTTTKPTTTAPTTTKPSTTAPTTTKPTTTAPTTTKPTTTAPTTTKPTTTVPSTTVPSTTRPTTTVPSTTAPTTTVPSTTRPTTTVPPTTIPPLPDDQEEIPSIEFTTTEKDTIIVYLGSKYAYYHNADCSLLIDMITPVSLSWAQYKGYKHCKECNPPK